MPVAPTAQLFTFRMVPLITGVLAERGVDVTPLLVAAGLPGVAVRQEITAPLSRVADFVERAAKAHGSPLFGLELAERVPSGTFGVAEFLMRSAPTISASLAVLCDFASLINPIGEFRLVDTASGSELHYAVAARRDTLGQHLNEYSMMLIVRQLGVVLGSRLPLERVWFSHNRKSHAHDVAARLATSVAFQAADCGFAVGREALARVPKTADPTLFEFMLAQARAQLATVGERDIVAQVARVIEVRLASGDVSTAAVASAMATTVRSLQRHLGDAGTSFREVLAHVRRRRRMELSRGMLDDAAIARHLGFADARAMRRSLDDSGDSDETDDSDDDSDSNGR